MHTGFREWLVVRLNRDDNLTWPAPVRHLVPSGWIHPLTSPADTEAVITLQRLLAEFFDAREQSDGLARNFRDYQSWLTTRPGISAKRRHRTRSTETARGIQPPGTRSPEILGRPASQLIWSPQVTSLPADQII